MRLLTVTFASICASLLVAVTAKNNFDDVKEGLPFCDLSSNSERFVIVSTLDGKITALNPDNGGAEVWTIHPGEAPMLSSSIHRLELSSFGQLIRMIPSLSGGLYSFNGEHVEAMPLTADHLLHSSFRYSDHLVMSGGKESQTFGISLKTGQILYGCTMSGCQEEAGSIAGDVLVVQRQGQVVRAIEPRTGAEQWNFSVAQHDVKLMSECHQIGDGPERLNLKVVIPEGLVCGVDSPTSAAIQWKHQFESPVVSAWEIAGGQLHEIDLFSTASHVGGESPGIYVGMHESQLYIQESVTMLKKREELLSSNFGQKLIGGKDSYPRLPWHPIAASAKSVGLIEGDEGKALERTKSTALSVLNASPRIDGHGFYLYRKEALKRVEDELCNVTTGDNVTGWEKVEEEETPVAVVIVSLWYWWKEVSIISITTALIFNLVFTRGYFRFRTSVKKSLEQPQSRSDSGVSLEELPRSRASSESDFVSRYLTDFEPVRCLGRGGFGVVFEAKNKIDDCHYAIKRIALPDNAASRERVLREVRALAKLDHQNIVRYFNSWLESPPPGWEEESKLPPLCSGDTGTAALAPSELDSVSKVSSVPTTPPKDSDPSDSFIVFATSSQNDHAILLESSETKTEQDSAHSTQTSICAKSRSQTSATEWCKGKGKVFLYIQMQLCQRKSLKEWLREHQDRDYQQVVHIFQQIVMAVEYVHLRNLIHRDLKPSNIFFSLDQQIKIGDFGLVATMDDGVGRASPATSDNRNGHTALVGTQLYMSPEQLAGKPYNYKVDIFSLGMILFELLVPFSTEMERLRVLQDVKKLFFPKKFTTDHKDEHDLLQVMLSHSPDERPTTIGVRSRPPLLRDQKAEDAEKWQFHLPPHSA